MKSFLINTASKLRTFLRRLYGRTVRSNFPQTEESMEAFVSSTLVLGGFSDTPSFRSLVGQAVLHETQGSKGLYPTLIIEEIERSIANAFSYRIIEQAKKAEKEEKAKVVNE